MIDNPQDAARILEKLGFSIVEWFSVDDHLPCFGETVMTYSESLDRHEVATFAAIEKKEEETLEVHEDIGSTAQTIAEGLRTIDEAVSNALGVDTEPTGCQQYCQSSCQAFCQQGCQAGCEIICQTAEEMGLPPCPEGLDLKQLTNKITPTEGVFKVQGTFELEGVTHWCRLPDFTQKQPPINV